MKNEFLVAVCNGDLDTARNMLKNGQPVDEIIHEPTGMQALHIATGLDNLPLVRLLVEDWKASFGPDQVGRWPSVIAAECEVSEETLDYIAEAEAMNLKDPLPRP